MLCVSLLIKTLKDFSFKKMKKLLALRTIKVVNCTTSMVRRNKYLQSIALKTGIEVGMQ
jgi:hypothetical protein